MKDLYVDIETSYNIGSFWRPGYNLTISPENIIREREIIMIGYMWEGDKKPTVLVWDYNAKSRDKKMLKEFSKIYAKADRIIAHNGAHFDLPWLRTRVLINNLKPLPIVKMWDTFKLVKNGFYFNSNKLDYLTKVTGCKGKIKTEFKLWDDVILRNNPKALAQMKTYCARDVLILQEFNKKISAHTPQPAFSRNLDNGVLRCTNGCVDKTLQKRGYTYAVATRRQRYQCTGCGSWYSGKLERL